MKEYYSAGNIKILLGDCREVLPSLPQVDLILTDPPYGINVDVGMYRQSGEQYGISAAPKGIYSATNWDTRPPEKQILHDIIAKGKNAILWGGNYFDIGPARCYLVWDKMNGDNDFADCELAWTNLDKAVRIKRHMWNGMLREGKEPRWGHPTQKPLAVMAWCIEMGGGNKGVRSILDPYMGSGTTLRAAKDAGIAATGIEVEEKYCEITAKRLQQEVFDFN